MSSETRPQMPFTPLPQKNGKVIEVHKSPYAVTVNTTLVVITIVVLVFSVIGAIAYYSFDSTLQARMQERKENELLYDDPNEKNILGLDDSLPELEFGKKAAAANTQQQQQQALKRPQAQTIDTPNGKQQIPPRPTSAPLKKETPDVTPSPSKTPDNIYVSKDGLFSIEHDKWSSAGSKTEGDTELETLESSDGKYKLYLGITKKKYDSIDAYLDTDPRGRKPKNNTEAITLGGESGKKALTFTGNFNGSEYKTIAAYVFSKDKESVYSLELDTTEMDINNKSNEEVFKKITDSFKFKDK